MADHERVNFADANCRYIIYHNQKDSLMFNIDFSKAFKEIAEVGSLVMIGLLVVLFLYASWGV